MSKKFEFFKAGRRNGKSAGTIEAIKKYVSGISQKDRDQIRRELEAEGGSDEEPSQPQFSKMRIIPYSTLDNTYYAWATSHKDYTWATASNSLDNQQIISFPATYIYNWESEQKQEILEDVQDVNFED